jgi:hypothetical protein
MKLTLAFALLACAFTTHARDIYVDPRTGDEHANGLASKPDGSNGPVKTIARGIKYAQPGDIVHLAPVVFKESAVFHDRVGEPGKPIVLDGHGATLDGGDPVDPATWPEVAPGLFLNDQLLRLDDAVIQRWFFFWGGKMNHMGRTSKGRSAPLKKPEDLQPGEWTFVKDPTRAIPNSQQIFGSFYLKLEPGQKLADANIVAPMRSAGVQFSGDNRHIVIRNVNATHVYNDGYNIHGHCEDVVFENITAVECGDDGISAHETAQYKVEGFISIGNSTGICDTGSSVTSYNRVFIRDCLGFDLFFLDSGRYTVTNCVVISSSQNPLSVNGRDQAEQPCSLTLDNVLIRRKVRSGEARVSKNSVLKASRVTFQNLGLQATGGEVTLENCAIYGEPAPDLILAKDVKWQGSHNMYGLRALRLDKATYSAETFAEFQKLTGQEMGTQWRDPAAVLPLPEGVGANIPALEGSVVPDSDLPLAEGPQ